jgi:hypothetical protein
VLWLAPRRSLVYYEKRFSQRIRQRARLGGVPVTNAASRCEPAPGRLGESLRTHRISSAIRRTASGGYDHWPLIRARLAGTGRPSLSRCLPATLGDRQVIMRHGRTVDISPRQWRRIGNCLRTNGEGISGLLTCVRLCWRGCRADQLAALRSPGQPRNRPVQRPMISHLASPAHRQRR